MRPPNSFIDREALGAGALARKTAAVLEAWHPGARDAEAIASILLGRTNPSGRLPLSFPASLDDLPRRTVEGARWTSIALGRPKTEAVSVDYDIEGSDVGYRWYARSGKRPLFAFGHGLTYKSFAYEGLRLSGGAKVAASFTVRNTGAREGADVPQLYLTNAAGRPRLRLAAFDKIALKPGESREVNLTVEPRILADWDAAAGAWRIAAGDYTFALGAAADDLKASAQVRLPPQRLKP